MAGAGREVEHDADRRRSIARAISLAAPGDVVVIAGKGHEQGQEFAGGRKEPFSDDATVAREALRSLVPRASSGAGPDKQRDSSGADAPRVSSRQGEPHG